MIIPCPWNWSCPPFYIHVTSRCYWKSFVFGLSFRSIKYSLRKFPTFGEYTVNLLLKGNIWLLLTTYKSHMDDLFIFATEETLLTCPFPCVITLPSIELVCLFQKRYLKVKGCGFGKDANQYHKDWHVTLYCVKILQISSKPIQLYLIKPI